MTSVLPAMDINSTPDIRPDDGHLALSSSTSSRVAGDIQNESVNQTGPDPVSKNQLKKLAKRERMLARRPELRRLEKERKKRKRLEQAAIRAEGGKQDIERWSHSRPFRVPMKESNNKFRVVLDMDFEGFMTDDEIGKAVKQCKNAYAINRKSPNPCQLYISSVRPGKICDRFATTCNGYENWDVNLSERDYIDTFLSNNQQALQEEAKQEARDAIRKKVIYLTADAEDFLPDVDEILKDESTIFVIGGLVDHNRHKNLCYTRAKERQIRTAKLPISENLKLCQRHILSTVTVFDILLNVLGEHKPWREALISAIPRRKIDPSEL